MEFDRQSGKVLILGNSKDAVSKARDKLELQEAQIPVPAEQTALVTSNLGDIKAKSRVQDCQLVGSGSSAKVRLVGTRVAVNVARSILEAQIKYDVKMKGLSNGTQLDRILAEKTNQPTQTPSAQAAAPSKPAGPERRKADDGSFYTREEFIEYYGGTTEWETAEKEKPKAAASSTAPSTSTSTTSSKSKSKPSPAATANGQVEFTREAFVAAFGDDTEFKKYERLKARGILPHWYKEQMTEKLKEAGALSAPAAQPEATKPAPTPTPAPAPAPTPTPTPTQATSPAEPEKRKADDGCMYTKEEFVEFFGGTTEWDLAAPKAAAAPVEEKPAAPAPELAAVSAPTPTPTEEPAVTEPTTTEDTTAEEEPQTELQKLFQQQQELVRDDPTFRYSNPSRAVASASSAGGQTGPEKRLSEDGTPYTKEEFIEFYGGTTEWDAAPIAESSKDYGAGGASSGERCYSWTQGTCRWGDRCKFVHEGEGGCIQTSQGLGPCYDFQAGTCTRGSSCRFSHDDDGGGGGGAEMGGGGGGGGGGEERRIAPDGSAYTKAEFQEFYEGLTEWDAAEVATGEAAGGGGGEEYGGDDGREACYSWTQYSCRWGEGCKYAHIGEGGCVDPQEARKQNGVCYQWQSGECFRGDSCKFAHEGEAGGGGGGGGGGTGEEKRIAPDGNAYTKAEFEEFYGGVEEWNSGEPAPADSGYGGGGGGGGYDDDKPACYDWSQYACRFGATCKFSHEGEGGPLAIEEIRKTSGPCYQWQEEGFCRFGDNCRFNHEGGPDGNGADTGGANGSAGEEEKRTSPDDGQQYTKQEFMDFYGGTTEWDAAAPPKKEEPAEEEVPEKRTSPDDGQQYTKEEFVEFYGGTTEWDAAAPATPKKDEAPTENGKAPDDPNEKRVAPDGSSYTKAEFVEFYGGTTEWDAAKPTGGLPKVEADHQESLKTFDSMLENGKMSVDEYAEKVAKLDSPHAA